MKADLGCVWPTDPTPGPYSTRIPFILLPGTLGIAWSKTTVTFGPWSAASPEPAPTVAMSVQTINAQMKRRPTDFVVLICFIVMFLSFVCRGTQPIFEMHFAEARIRAGDEALIVYFDAVVE